MAKKNTQGNDYKAKVDELNAESLLGDSAGKMKFVYFGVHLV